MQKAKRKAESSSRASESTAFIHVEKKGTARKDRQRGQEKEEQQPLPLTFPYK